MNTSKSALQAGTWKALSKCLLVSSERHQTPRLSAKVHVDKTWELEWCGRQSHCLTFLGSNSPFFCSEIAVETFFF